jgi:hypothetical protein
MRKLLGVLALLVVGTGAAFAQSPQVNPQAKKHLDTGLQLYEAKDYVTSIEEFKKGYAIDPQPIFLYTWAQAERMSGDCPTAIKLYKQFLATSPNPSARALAEQNLGKCVQTIDEDEEPKKPIPEDKPPVVIEEKKPFVDEGPAAPRRAWYADPVGGVITGLGIVGVGVGVGFFISSQSAEQAAQDATRYDQFAENMDRARSQRTISLIALAGGGVLVVTGIVWYATHAGGPATETRRPGVGMWIDGTGGGVAFSGDF